MFLDKKTSMSTLEGLRLALRRLTISPALEKTLSDGTDVAGIPKYLRANMVRRGYRPPFNFHHCKGLVLISGVRSCVYRTTSSIGLRSCADDDWSAYLLFWTNGSHEPDWTGSKPPLAFNNQYGYWNETGYPGTGTGTRVRVLKRVPGYPGTRSEHYSWPSLLRFPSIISSITSLTIPTHFRICLANY